MEYRNKTCGELSINDVGQSVILSGWIHSIRKKKTFVWLDLRDYYGIVQLFVENTINCDCLNQLGREDVIRVQGVVNIRPNPNKKLETGDIEVKVSQIMLLNKCKGTPFTISNDLSVDENIRLKYRFFDLRREEMKNNLILRHKVAMLSRSFLISKGFIEVDTPCLTKSSVSGAHEFTVPSAKHKRKAYTLAQSPQLFMQLLMVGGFDKCFQIAHCFCDEDLRVDRQPEFHQLHCEMAFAKQKDVLELFDTFIRFVFFNINHKMLDSIPILSWEACMAQYGTDKPDIRKDNESFSPLWVIDIPMFKWNKEEHKYKAVHHPFIAPKEEDIPLLFNDNSIEKIRTQSYNLIINGVKVGGSSIRISDKNIQNKVFQIMGLTNDEITEKYGFLLDAFSYGVPPHAGMTFGFDRLCSIMNGSNNVRDYMAFPKNSHGKDVMLKVPEPIEKSTLQELGLEYYRNTD